MEITDKKKEYNAPEEVIQFIVDTRDGKFNSSTVKLDMPAGRLPNYHHPTDPVYLHGIR